MSSVILEKDFGMTRDELMKKLKAKMIDTRPFFYPISMFPMYKEQKNSNCASLRLGRNKFT